MNFQISFSCTDCRVSGTWSCRYGETKILKTNTFTPHMWVKLWLIFIEVIFRYTLLKLTPRTQVRVMLHSLFREQWLIEKEGWDMAFFQLWKLLGSCEWTQPYIFSSHVYVCCLIGGLCFCSTKKWSALMWHTFEHFPLMVGYFGLDMLLPWLMTFECNFLEVKRSSRLTARAINVNE